MALTDLTRKSPFEAFGIECDEGWKGLYAPLIDLCKLYGVEVMQVKEKFGGLRFYIGPVPEGVLLSQLIAAAEAHSYHVCERCGSGQAVTRRGDGSGWTKSLCPSCHTARAERIQADRAEMEARQKAAGR